MSICDRDCFHCKYDDCILEELEAVDYDEQRRIEREIVFPQDRKKKIVAAKQRAYYEANRDKIAAKQRAYREANRDKIAAKQRAYREANRDKYNDYMRSYMRRRGKDGQDKEAAQ